MLGKLYITSNSSSELLATVAELVQEAIDNKVLADAASRTALNKLQTMVKKALGECNAPASKQQLVEEEKEEAVKDEEEEETAAPKPTATAAAAAAESVLDEPEATEMGEEKTEELGGLSTTHAGSPAEAAASDEGTTIGQDSLLEELLDEDGDVEMTM